MVGSSSRNLINVTEQLGLFRFRAKQLEEARLLRNSASFGLTIRASSTEGMSFSSQEPDEEDLRSFLLSFRQFILNDDPVYLFKIYNLCQKHITSDKLKKYLVQSREAWKKGLKKGGINLIFNEREITPEYVIDLWINGWYFHNDIEKLTKLQRLLPHEHMLVRQHFLSSLLEATWHVLYVAHIVTVALRDGLVSN